MKIAYLVAFSLLAAHCGKKKDDADSPPVLTKHSVAVIDSGFDIDNAVFKKNLVEATRVLCINTGKNPLTTMAAETRFGELKSNFIAYLGNRSDCVSKKKLNDGVSPAFANIQGDFNDWNAAVKNGTINRSPVRAKVETILAGEDGKFNYHGTATAGLIAEDNSKIDLYLIEPDLGQLMLPNEAYSRGPCRTQVEIDLKARLFEDKEVQSAFADPARSDADSVIVEFLKARNVTMINESYGPMSAGEFAEYYRKKDCPPVDFKREFLAESAISRLREKALEARYDYRPLHIRAAGNAGEELNLESDTLDPCKDDDNYLMVGSIDGKDKLSKFSNRGRCVEVYTLGSQVIVNAPRDFLTVKDGTSYSAPLILRYLTLHLKPGETNMESLRTFALSASDHEKYIKSADWNRDYAYKPKDPAPDEPNPPVNNGGGQAEGYKEGWALEVVNQKVQDCVPNVQQLGVALAPAQAYCDCAVKGLAKKYTAAEFQLMADDAVAADPVVAQCRQQHIPG